MTSCLGQRELGVVAVTGTWRLTGVREAAARLAAVLWDGDGHGEGTRGGDGVGAALM